MFRLIAVLVTIVLMGLLAVLVMQATGGDAACPKPGETTTTLLPANLQRQLEAVRQPGTQLDC